MVQIHTHRQNTDTYKKINLKNLHAKKCFLLILPSEEKLVQWVSLDRAPGLMQLCTGSQQLAQQRNHFTRLNFSGVPRESNTKTAVAKVACQSSVQLQGVGR